MKAGNEDQKLGNTYEDGENDKDTILVHETKTIGKLDEHTIIQRLPQMTKVYVLINGKFKEMADADVYAKKFAESETVKKGWFKKEQVVTYPDNIIVIQTTSEPFAITCPIEIPLSDNTFVKGTVKAGLMLNEQTDTMAATYLNHGNAKQEREGNYFVRRLTGEGFMNQYRSFIEDCTTDIAMQFNSVIEVIKTLNGNVKARVNKDDYLNGHNIAVQSINLRFDQTTWNRLQQERSKQEYKDMYAALKIDDVRGTMELYDELEKLKAKKE